MQRTHIALNDADRRTKLKRALRSCPGLTVWESPDFMLKSISVGDEDIAIVPESWAARNRSVIGDAPPPIFVVDLEEAKDEDNAAALAKKAYGYLDAGATECLTREMKPKDIRGVMDFVSYQSRDEKGDFQKKTLLQWGAVGVAALIFAGMLIFMGVKKEPGAQAQQGSFFHVLLPSPTGIAVHKGQAWICDFFSQTITSFRITQELIPVRKFSFEGFIPVALCAGDEGLWSLGNDARVRLHVFDGDQHKVKALYDLEGQNLSGLAWDGESLWSCDWENKELVRIEVLDLAVIRERHPLDMKQPIGVVIDGHDVWVLDSETGTIHSYHRKAAGLELKRKVILPHFAPEMNRPGGFGGNGMALWITADKSGLVYRVRP